MRMFWALIAALTVMTGLLWAMSPDESRPYAVDDGSASPNVAEDDPLMPPSSTPPSSRPASSDSDALGPDDQGPDDQDPADSDAGDADDAELASDESGGDAMASAGNESDAPESGSDPAADDLSSDLIDDFEARTEVPGLDEFGEEGPELAEAERDSDGGFVIEGDGTESSPYRVTWDMLLSAAETYAPRMGKTELPEHIKKLDDAHVEITGYIAFPTAGENTDELLVMLNEWDGCCLGVPPSPYDAIEVRLASPIHASTGTHEAQYGTVRGLMDVDPYVIEDWLIGLYLMDNASLSLGGE